MKDELRSLHQRFIDLSNQSDTYEARTTFAFCADEIESLLNRAEASPVDDAMLDRALDALRQGQYEGDQFRDSMRRALTAAMQQTEKK